MKKKSSKLLVAVIIFCIIPVNTVFADVVNKGNGNELAAHDYGYIDPELSLEWDDEDSKLQQDGNFPGTYDMRTQEYGKNIEIRDQMDTGLCWAFSTMTAAEINYYHTNGTDAPAVMFSPLHLGYFTYNRVADPMFLTRYDKNTLNRDNYKMVGGNCAIAMNSLSGWTGFVAESKMPFENRYASSFDKSLAYDNELTLKGSYLINPNDQNAIKAAVMKYGSVTTNIYMYDGYEFERHLDRNGVYNSRNGSSNHQVVVIGWDDSKRAWLIQNSWGSEWNGDGCFYVSYDEQSMSLMAAIEVQPAEKYELNYFYDGTAGVEQTYARSGQQFANVFTGYNDRDEETYHSLEAVGLTIYDTGYCEYTIDIYTGCNPGDPASGVKSLSFDAETETAGFHTFELPSPVKIEDGQRYSIVITFHQETAVAIETTSRIGNDVTFSARTSRGQSFYSDSRGEFVDYNNDNISVRIKGFTSSETYRTVDINRYAGTTRYITAEEVSNALKDLQQVQDFETVIIASGENYPDALSGSYLSKVNDNAPILLTSPTQEANTIRYISNNLKNGGIVYILGGTGAVSNKIESDLNRKGFYVKRLAGNNRYETNLAILEETKAYGEDILVCSGSGYADSLSASAVGKPILLVGDTLSREQHDYLAGLYDSDAYIVGGIGAVNADLEFEMMPLVDKVHRLEGLNRYHTSALVAETFFEKGAPTVVFAYGQNFPDGLSGGPLALELGAPLLLVDNYKANAEYAKAYVGTIQELYTVNVLGGKPLIPDDILQYISR